LSSENLKQKEFWLSEFANSYMNRNSNIDYVNNNYKEKTGLTEEEVFIEFFSDLDKDLKILEVGCNVGVKISMLQKMGFTNLTGLELNKNAYEIAKKNYPDIEFINSDIEEYETDKKYDLVYTCGVLIHLNPAIISNVVKKIFSLSKIYIFGFESYSEKLQEVRYRENLHVQWKQDFLGVYMKNFPELEILKQKKITYLNDEKAFTKEVGEEDYTEKNESLQDIAYLLKK
tara:strand:+ start:3774 stop:4463 length:690 start_codon:yes stop_codon:yes gene_type:complete